MKLPFKIPSIKLPKLPKLPKFGKKKADDDEDDEDFEGFDDLGDLDDAGDAEAPDAVADDGDDEATPEQPATQEPSAESEPPAEDGDGADSDDMGEKPASGSDDMEDMDEEMPDFGDDDDEDDDDDEEGGGAKKKRLMMIGGGVFVALLLAGGGAWYFMSGDDAGVEAGALKLREGVDPDVPRVEMAIAPKKRKSGGLNAIAAGISGPGAGVSVAAVDEAAFASFASPVGDQVALAAATDPSLIEETPQGPLPKIAEDGRKPWQVYARPFKAAAGERRLGLIVSGLGLSIAATDAAIRLLPGSVTLAFDPYADGLQEWAAKARQAGHEVLMMMPLESGSFPYEDPGPKALTTTNDPDENRFRMEFVLSRMSGYVGVLTTMGSKFAESDEHLRTFLEEINRRGLILVEGKNEASTLATTVAAEIGLPRVAVDVVLDDIPSKQAIDRSFGEVEEVIAGASVGVGVAEPYPASIERIIAWGAALKDKKIALAPITAIVGRQPAK